MKYENLKQLMKGFYFITDHHLSRNGNVNDVKLALESGVKVIQFREKKRSKVEFIEEVIEIKSLCKSYNAIFIINDDLELAQEIDADGIHVGQEDASLYRIFEELDKGKIIGVSVHNIEEAKKANQEGAGYLGVGHIFHTDTKKKNSPPIGTEMLQEIRQVISIPLVAIGGITVDTLASVIEAGADMVCAVSDSLKNGQVEDNIKSYYEIFDSRLPY